MLQELVSVFVPLSKPKTRKKTTVLGAKVTTFVLPLRGEAREFTKSPQDDADDILSDTPLRSDRTVNNFCERKRVVDG